MWQYLTTLSDEPELALGLALAGLALGIVLWLGGRRLGQSIITLTGVAGGAMLGLYLPRWLEWPVQGMAPAIGGAVLAGVWAFAWHRTWLAVGFGLALAGWLAAILWMILGDGAWAWPALKASASFADYPGQLWESLPGLMKGILPWACCMALGMGVLLVILLPRLGEALAYSALGVTLSTLAILWGISLARPEWLDHIPQQQWIQALVLLCLVSFGIIAQWRSNPPESGADKDKKKPPASAAPAKA